MGWVEGQYYEKFAKQKGISNKITLEQEAMNKLSVFEVAQAIQVVQHELARENKGISKTHVKDSNLDVPYMKYVRDEENEYIIPEVGVDVSKMHLEDENIDISKMNLKDGNLDIAYVKVPARDTKVEEKDKDLGDER